MSKDFEQDFAGADESEVGPPRRGRPPIARERPFKLGPLGTLNQIIVALGKSIRAMADGTLDSQVGARICNGLGIMRACLETRKLEQLESRMDERMVRHCNLLRFQACGTSAGVATNFNDLVRCRSGSGGNSVGVVSVLNLESSGVGAPERRPRHDKRYHEV